MVDSVMYCLVCTPSCTTSVELFRVNSNLTSFKGIDDDRDAGSLTSDLKYIRMGKSKS